MLVFLSIALFFVFAGGQVAVLITEFIQGIFANTVFLVLVIYFLVIIGWDQIFAAVSHGPAGCIPHQSVPYQSDARTSTSGTS